MLDLATQLTTHVTRYPRVMHLLQSVRAGKNGGRICSRYRDCEARARMHLDSMSTVVHSVTDGYNAIVCRIECNTTSQVGCGLVRHGVL